MRVPTREDIVSVQAMWSSVIWLHDADQRPVGFQAPVYFVSGETQRGAFVNGNITVTMSEVTSDSRGAAASTLRLLHEWKLDSGTEKNFRIRRRAVGGYYYGLRLRWPENLQVYGKQVEIGIAYQRRDGAIVKAIPRRDMVLRNSDRSVNVGPTRRYAAPQTARPQAESPLARQAPAAAVQSPPEQEQTYDEQGRPTVIVKTRLK